MAETDEIAVELYLVPPTRFVATRDQLVRQAREGGEKPLAQELQRLRRPAPSAWLVNLLVRHERTAVEGLLTLGRELRRAQLQLDEPHLRRLAGQRRERITDLVERARALARDAGWHPSPAALAEVEASLRAALVDLAAAATLLSGRLVRPMSHTGFGPLPDLDLLDPHVSAAQRPPSPPSSATVVDMKHFWSTGPGADVTARRPAPAPDDGGTWQVTTLLPSGHDGEPAPGREVPTQDLHRADDVRRAQLRLATAESAHWQREQELLSEEAAAESARERVEMLDQQRMMARRERVAADNRVAAARAAQREAVLAVEDARRMLQEAESRLLTLR